MARREEPETVRPMAWWKKLVIADAQRRDRILAAAVAWAKGRGSSHASCTCPICCDLLAAVREDREGKG